MILCWGEEGGPPILATLGRASPKRIVTCTAVQILVLFGSSVPTSLQHRTRPDASCCSLTKWTDALFHIQNSISITYPSLANNSCPPIFPNGTSIGGDPNAGSKGCSIGKYLDFVVNATSPEVISTTLKWASEKNIRVVIKNTGHNHLGRYALDPTYTDCNADRNNTGALAVEVYRMLPYCTKRPW